MADLRERLRELYLGRDATAALFQRGLLAFDLLVLVYFVIVALLPTHRALRLLDLAIACALVFDRAARVFIAPRPWARLFHLWTLLDIAIVVTLLLPPDFGNLGFVRILRTLRILRSYHVLGELRRRSSWVDDNEEVLRASVHLGAFVYVLSAVVYVTQAGRSPGIETYLDAVYFTITTLTTTGFGDVVLEGDLGRLLAIVVMIVGIGLFLRLVQAVFRPAKVRHACPRCGLQRHEIDAVHCKACGKILDIPDEGR